MIHLRPGARVARYGDRLIVDHPNHSPYYIDLETGERYDVELGAAAADLDWRTEIDGLCKP